MRPTTFCTFALLAQTLLVCGCSSRDGGKSSVSCQTAADCANYSNNEVACLFGRCIEHVSEVICSQTSPCRSAEAVCLVDTTPFCDGCSEGICIGAEECPADAQCLPGETATKTDAGADASGD